MKKDAKIEEILLSDENYEKMVKEKTEQDFKKILETGNSATDKYITDIKSVPPDMLL